MNRRRFLSFLGLAPLAAVLPKVLGSLAAPESEGVTKMRDLLRKVDAMPRADTYGQGDSYIVGVDWAVGPDAIVCRRLVETRV